MDYIKKYEMYLTTEKRSSANTVSSYLRDIRQFFEYAQHEKFQG